MAYTKKGAMFGLDARIALAIFGALSVISGAALYSAIQDSKVTAIVTEMDNVGKATTAYYLDTGIYPAGITGTTGGDTNTLDASKLVSDTTSGWQGPYLSFEISGTRKLDHPIYTDVTLYALIDADWSDATASASKCKTNTSGTCSVYICYTGLSADIQKAAEVKVDGTYAANNEQDGNFRYAASGESCLKALTFPKTSAVD